MFIRNTGENVFAQGKRYLMYRARGIWRGGPPFRRVGYYSFLYDVPEKKVFGGAVPPIRKVGYRSRLYDVPGKRYLVYRERGIWRTGEKLKGGPSVKLDTICGYTTYR